MSLGSLPTLLLLPPLNLLLAATFGGRALRRIGLGGLWLLSLPLVSGSLVRLTEIGLGGEPPPGPPPQAIVILSGDQSPAREGQALVWNVGPLTLEREQAGANLARRTHLPVLVSGGAVHPWSPPLANLMAYSLIRDFGIQVRWQEPASQDTWANAVDSAALLRPAGITRVYVVTQAWHMRRALLAFRRAGLQPVAAPVRLDALPQFHAGAFLPSVRAWGDSYFALHELIGWAWYEVRPG